MALTDDGYTGSPIYNERVRLADALIAAGAKVDRRDIHSDAFVDRARASWRIAHGLNLTLKEAYLYAGYAANSLPVIQWALARAAGLGGSVVDHLLAIMSGYRMEELVPGGMQRGELETFEALALAAPGGNHYIVEDLIYTDAEVEHEYGDFGAIIETHDKVLAAEVDGKAGQLYAASKIAILLLAVEVRRLHGWASRPAVVNAIADIEIRRAMQERFAVAPDSTPEPFGLPWGDDFPGLDGTEVANG